MWRSRLAIGWTPLLILAVLAAGFLLRRADTDHGSSIAYLAAEVAALRDELRSRSPEALARPASLNQWAENSRNPRQVSDASTDETVAVVPAPSVSGGVEWREQLHERIADDDARQAALDAEVHAGPSNRRWESEVTEYLDQALSISQLGGSRIVNLRCGTSVCRVEVSHGSSVAQDGLPIALMNTLPTGYDQWGRNLDDRDGLRTLVYFARHEVRVISSSEQEGLEIHRLVGP